MILKSLDSYTEAQVSELRRQEKEINDGEAANDYEKWSRAMRRMSSHFPGSFPAPIKVGEVFFDFLNRLAAERTERLKRLGSDVASGNGDGLRFRGVEIICCIDPNV